MSLEAIIWALREAECTPAEKLVLAVLCNWIDEHTDCSWPSVATIKGWTGQSARTIGRAIAGLETAGLVARPTDQNRRKGRFAQNVLHIGLHGRACPPSVEVVDACLEIMRHRRRSAPSVNMADGRAPSANMAHGNGQNGSDRRPICPPASNEDPVSFSSDKKPVRGDRAAPCAGDAPTQPGRKVKKTQPAAVMKKRPKPKGKRPDGIAGQLFDLQDAVGRHNPGLASNYIDPLRVVDGVVLAPTQLVLDEIRKRMSTDFRIYGIDVDRIELDAK